MEVIIGLIPLLIILGLSLILPIIVVLRWKLFPKLALFAGTAICFLTLAAMTIFSVFILNKNGSIDPGIQPRAILGVGMISLIFGLPFLATIQWRSRRKLKRKTALSAEQTKTIFD